MSSHNHAEDLIEQARTGDREAQERLAVEYRDRVDNYVRLRVGDHLRKRVEIGDVVQQTFANAFKSLEQFRGKDGETFLRWLRGIAEHVILELARYHRREQVLYMDHDEVSPSDVSPSRSLRRDERFDRLKEALESLSPDHRDVVVMARLKGLRIDEIARRMNRSPNAVAHLLSRALVKLRKAFGETESFSLPPRRLENEGSNHAE
jgi:RNA polymerase sigma-70 factor (ECF subfamily)